MSSVDLIERKFTTTEGFAHVYCCAEHHPVVERLYAGSGR